MTDVLVSQHSARAPYCSKCVVLRRIDDDRFTERGWLETFVSQESVGRINYRTAFDCPSPERYAERHRCLGTIDNPVRNGHRHVQALAASDVMRRCSLPVLLLVRWNGAQLEVVFPILVPHH